MERMSYHYLLPLFVHVLIVPFWFIEKYAYSVSTVEIIMSTVLIPIYLVVVSAKQIIEISTYQFIRQIQKMGVVVYTGLIIQYFAWGFSTGRTFKPDSGTVALAYTQIVISTAIISLGLLTIFIAKRTR